MDFQHVKEFLSIKGASAVQVGYFDGNSPNVHNFGETNASSLFDIASVSKVAQTTFLFMNFQEAKRLSVDDPIGKYLPEIRDDLKQVKLRYFLSHTAGVPAWIPFYFFDKPYLDVINDFKPSSKPGENRVYSDVGFILLGKVLERISGQNIVDLFKKEIIEPLALKNTFHEQNVPKKRCLQTSKGNPFEQNLAKQRGFSEPDNFKWRTRPIIGEVNDFNCHQAFGGQSGHAGLFSNAADLMTIGRALMQHPQFEYFTGQIHERNSLGFLNRADWLRFTFSDSTVGHHGFTGCSLILDAKEKKIMTFLSNRQRYGLIDGKYPEYKNYFPEK